MERRAERRRQRSARQNCAAELRAELRGGGARLHRILDALHLAEHLEDALVARLELGVVRLRRPLPLHLHRRRLLRPPPAVFDHVAERLHAALALAAAVAAGVGRRRVPRGLARLLVVVVRAAVLARQHPPPLRQLAQAGDAGDHRLHRGDDRALLRLRLRATAGRRGGVDRLLPRRLALVVEVVRAPVRRRRLLPPRRQPARARARAVVRAPARAQRAAAADVARQVARERALHDRDHGCGEGCGEGEAEGECDAASAIATIDAGVCRYMAAVVRSALRPAPPLARSAHVVNPDSYLEATS